MNPSIPPIVLSLLILGPVSTVGAQTVSLKVFTGKIEVLETQVVTELPFSNGTSTSSAFVVDAAEGATIRVMKPVGLYAGFDLHYAVYRHETETVREYDLSCPPSTGSCQFFVQRPSEAQAVAYIVTSSNPDVEVEPSGVTISWENPSPGSLKAREARRNEATALEHGMQAPKQLPCVMMSIRADRRNLDVTEAVGSFRARMICEHHWIEDFEIWWSELRPIHNLRGIESDRAELISVSHEMRVGNEDVCQLETEVWGPLAYPGWVCSEVRYYNLNLPGSGWLPREGCYTVVAGRKSNGEDYEIMGYNCMRPSQLRFDTGLGTMETVTATAQ